MKSALWLIIGIFGGFVAAHQINKTPQGKQFFADLEGKVKDFGGAVADGYRAREAELRSAVSTDAQNVVSADQRHAL
ncbi:MAG: hypothetical protein ACYCZK_02445 [Microbacteriaceae bacterium]